MADIRTIKRRIKSVKNTKQITKAMELVSAAKMRRAQSQVLASRPYIQYLKKTLTNLAALIHATGMQVSHPLLETREIKKTYLVVFAPDKGLCGGLPTNIMKKFFNEITQFASSKEYQVITVGKKISDFAKRSKLPCLADFIKIKDNPNFSETTAISKIILDDYATGKVDEVKIVFPQFLSTLSQEILVHTLLPIKREEIFIEDINAKSVQEEKVTATKDYLFEPNPQSIFSFILPYFVEMTVYQSLLESKASEHSARMVAMQSASDKSEDVIFDLSLSYNTARQAAITREVAEISAGADAVK